MKEFKLIWEIEVIANTHEEAAKIALDIQRDRGSLATIFSVIGPDGLQKEIDADEPIIDENEI